MSPRTVMLARALVPAVLGAIALAVVAAPACSSTTLPPTSGDFYSPGGLAIAPARDRDILVIASTGSDELRAITLCNTPALPDGGAPNTTCLPSDDFQFLPGPIRVFPGSFPVGNRPVRVASLRMKTDAGAISGAVLVAGVATLVDGGGTGAQPALKMVDTVDLVDAVQKTIKTIKKADDIGLDAPPIDVVTVENSPTQIFLSDAGPGADGGSNEPAAGAPGTAFALTQAALTLPDGGGAAPTAVSRITVDPQPSGPVATVTGRCSLDILATRIAVAPGRSDVLYVGDGTPNPVAHGKGDGVVELDASAAAMPPVVPGATPPPCMGLDGTIGGRRFSATHPDVGVPHGIYALALAPAWFSADGRTFPTGSFLVGVTAEGRLVIWRTDTRKLAPLPPFRPIWGGGVDVQVSGGATAIELGDGGIAPLIDTLPFPAGGHFTLADGGVGDPYPASGRYPDGGSDFPGDAGPDEMHVFAGVKVPQVEPLREGQAREVAFLKVPVSCPASTAQDTPCVLVRVGPNSAGNFPQKPFGLVAAVTTADGNILFLDVEHRRFISNVRDATDNSLGSPAALTSNDVLVPTNQAGLPAPPILVLTPAVSTTTHDVDGWLTAGVSRNSRWRLIWHAQVPGLERRGGTLSRDTASGDLHFEIPAIDLARWSGLLGVGDVVAFDTFSHPDGSAVCAELQTENANPLSREYSITAIGTTWLRLAPSTSGTSGADGGVSGFNPPDACLAGALGATLEVRTAAGLGNQPWLVLQGNEVRGRAATNVLERYAEPRFDYPLEYTFDPANLGKLPTVDNDIGLSFTITGVEPRVAGSYFSIQIGSGQSPARVSDTTSLGGFAGPAVTYTSKKLIGNLLFGSITGANSVLQVDPALIGILGGVIAYR